MDNKKVGMLLIVLGIILLSSVQINKSRDDQLISKIVAEQDTCFLDDGTCLHDDRDLTAYFTGIILSAVLIALGLFLILFEKGQKEIVTALHEQKHLKIEEEKFSILLRGLTKEEKRVIVAVKNQDGITQQTLRLRTDLHKSKLSIVLDGLEKKDLIKRVDHGKTKKVFLKINL
ncbi:hypothetical protein HN592_00630 [Candidatus Woesearchaeota archaeon]|jgi:hypothetical protein|nr:hypothetical protein [Candidatus Woesearchaeota archaeon]MBT4368809.1 hypothetical protein [Candidatus Woesearchaeota archaeon]MBT4712098.1 hypothetical protein [Candidatus Woesearchaeota archaeon]MBT6639154.1 hypothetical protein [Candidatus Woesearchaeota archaeon]MBT7134354.1 hypothetical protein [Candidatus Woesearchaeota archaeon]